MSAEDETNSPDRKLRRTQTQEEAMNEDIISMIKSLKEELLNEMREMKTQMTEGVKAEVSTLTEAVTSLKRELATLKSDLRKEMEAVKQELLKELSEVQSTAEFNASEILLLKEKLKEQDSELKRLAEKAKAEEAKAVQLASKCEDLERYSRSYNLRFFGLPEKKDENCIQVLKDVCREKLDLSAVDFENAHRIGKSFDGRPRQIIAKFMRRSERLDVLFSAKKLRGTNIFINEDLLPSEAAKKRTLLPILKKARSEGRRAFFRGPTLYIDGEKYA